MGRKNASFMDLMPFKAEKTTTKKTLRKKKRINKAYN